MADGILLGMGFNLKSPLPIDSRLNFKTIADMASYPDSDLPETYFCTNDETGLFYTYAKTNDVDPDLGKWRALTGSSSIEFMTDTECQTFLDDLVITSKNYVPPVAP